MKIILSPSKTRNLDIQGHDLIETVPLFENHAQDLATTIGSFSIEALAKIMKIKNDLLDQTYNAYLHYHSSKRTPAIYSYTGTVFKELELGDYNKNQLDYMNDNLIIMSALYGFLKPSDGIKNYRLDMTMKIMDQSLYSFWKQRITEDIFLNASEDIILNLASGEFSKMLPTRFITIDFKEMKNGKLKTVGTYSKKARGLMANFIIKHQLTRLDQVKEFTLEGYAFSKEHSNETRLTFVR